jgi:uncharacterized protein YrrD
MQRASDLYGLPVVDSSTGREIGAVNELLVDLPRGRLVALVLSGPLIGEPGVLPVDGMQIGSEELRLADRDITRGEEASSLRHGKLTLDRTRKLTVITRSGDRLGNVEDLILDGSRIAGLELSDGLIKDIFQGRCVLELSEEAEFIGEQVIVPDETTCQTYQNQGTGIWRRDQGF